MVTPSVLSAVRREALGVLRLEKIDEILSDVHGHRPEVAFVLLDRHRMEAGGWHDELHWAFIDYIVADVEEQMLFN